MAVDTELVRIDNVEKELWDKIVNSAEGSSTGGVLVVNATVADGGAISDKSFAEVETAINNGKAVLLCLFGEVFIGQGIYDNADDDSRYVQFVNFTVDLVGSSAFLNYSEYRLGSESNVLTYAGQDFALTPFE